MIRNRSAGGMKFVWEIIKKRNKVRGRKTPEYLYRYRYIHYIYNSIQPASSVLSSVAVYKRGKRFPPLVHTRVRRGCRENDRFMEMHME